MPSYAPAKPVTPKPRGRVGSRHLSLDWKVRKDNARGVIHKLRDLAWVDTDPLNEALLHLNDLADNQSNTAHKRTFALINAAICTALGITSRSTPRANIDVNDPPLGLRFMIEGDTFVIRSHTPGTYPAPSTITGYWAHNPTAEVTLDSTQYSHGVFTAATTYGHNLDSFLLRHHSRLNGLVLGAKFYPRNSNRARTQEYELTKFLSLNHLMAKVDGKPKIITVKQWKLWRERSRTGKN